MKLLSKGNFQSAIIKCLLRFIPSGIKGEKMQYIALFICAFLISAPLRAQELTPEKIRIYTMADGLPSNIIFCADQDAEGNLWIGTSKGASRFDGKAFVNYGAAQGFSDKSVWTILCDSKGKIWFGTSGDGLFCFDGTRWSVFTEEKDRLPSNNFFNGFLYEDSRGTIWGSPQYGANLFRYSGDTFVTVMFQIADIAEDGQKNIYAIKSNSSFLYRFSETENLFREVYSQFRRTRNLCTDQNGHIWVATESYFAKSEDAGHTFRKFEFGEDLGRCWDMFVDDRNQVWAAYSNAVIRLDKSDKSAFHYFRQQSGLLSGSYKHIFQDRQRQLWFCGTGGLAKFDVTPPAADIPDTVSDIVKSPNISFQVKGDDGKLGSPPEDLIYEFRPANEEGWRKADHGQVYVDQLKNSSDYPLLIRVTDSFGNSLEKMLSLHVELDNKIPNVEIVNRKEFAEAVDSAEVRFRFTGEDNQYPDDLLFSFMLEKDGKIYRNWEKWSKEREAPFQDLQSGEYVFSVKAKDKSWNESEVSKLIFTLISPRDKPKISLSQITSCHVIEKENLPIIECGPAEEKISSGRISFFITADDPGPEKKELKYSVFLEPEMREWSLYRDDSFYPFHDLPDGNYHLKVRAKDQKGIVSDIIEKRFTAEGFARFPQTRILSEESFGRGKIVGRFFSLCCESDAEEPLFSYQLDKSDWIPFTRDSCFEFPQMEDGKHVIKVVSKNKFGIDPMPDSYEFHYERVADLPFVKLRSKPPNFCDKNTVQFEFDGEDDMNGDQTPPEELRYAFRLMPVRPNWTKPSPETKISYPGLENGPYFFQVKAFDKNENESVVPAEYFFTVKVVPFYQKGWFLWAAGIMVLTGCVGAAIVLTRRRTKKFIYEQRYNPYVVGEAVHDPEMFFGRATAMQDIFQSIRNNSLCLTGERRIGKTTLLEHIDKNMAVPFFSFFCNLESVKEAFFFSRIMQHLVNKVRSIWPESLPGLVLFEKERHEYDEIDFEEDIESVLDFLRKNYAPDASVIMCLDEIDATQEFAPNIHQSLRNVFQTYHGMIRMVAAGVSIKRGEWRLPTSPWYNFFEFKDVSELDRESAERLIIMPVIGFYSYDIGALDFIPYKTDSKPFYIQMICKKAINKILDEKRRKVTLEDVKTIYDNLIRSELNREFENFWENLSAELQKTILQAMKDEDTPVSAASERELMNNTYNHGHRVIKAQNGKLKFATMFRDWLKINYISEN